MRALSVTGEPLRWRLIQQPQDTLVGGLHIDRLLARPRRVLQPFRTMTDIAMPPKADDPRMNSNFLGDRPDAATGSRQQDDPRALQIALERDGIGLNHHRALGF